MSLPAHGGLDGLVTLLGGGTVCVARPDGVITPDRLTGLYHRDIRVLSAAELRLDGRRPPMLTEARDDASTARHVYVIDANAHGDPTAVLVHRRHVDGELRETFEIHVFAGEVRGARLELALAVDFGELLRLKAGHPAPAATPLRAFDDAAPAAAHLPDARRWRAEHGSVAVEILAGGGPGDDANGTLAWTVDAAPGQPWSVDVVVRPLAPPLGRPADGGGRGRLQVRSTSAWQPAVASALDDLHALRVEVPDRGLSYLAAGAPWFMALFGRDSLLTAWMSLIDGTTLALDVLEGLANHQGQVHDPDTGEQPGRILHELRTGQSGVFGVPPGEPYYGTVDATALLVVVLAEAYRWGADVDRIRRLLPAARAAVAWCQREGDLDGDGFVEYLPDAGGLTNQGWKDSGDAMVHRDGSLARGPIALAEVQAYVYRALLDLARLESDLGDATVVAELRRRADALRDRFVEAFLLPERSLVAMALDGDKQPLSVWSSNPGHCLWAGILPKDLAHEVAGALAASPVTAWWGLRTLGADEQAYNPLSYHLGSIWPHDSAIAAAGLMRAGHREAAGGIARGLLAACGHFDWRLPELFAGFDRDEIHFPVAYPVACSPQAWSAAAPLLLLRTMLQLDPDIPAGTVHLDPAVDPDTSLEISGIRLGDGRLDLTIAGGTATVTAGPDGVEVIRGRAPAE